MKKNKAKPLSKMCSSCPFRPGSEYAELSTFLALSALTESSRICHSTGSNAINRRTGKKPALCRGSRDIQLRYFHAIGFIKKPTDEAWDERCKKMNISNEL